MGGLVREGGVISLYLYGQESVSGRSRAALELRRLALAPLPFELKRRLIARRGVDVHQAFDQLSPVINSRHTFEQVQGWLERDGFSGIDRTIDHSELFVRAEHGSANLDEFDLPRPSPPYWFDRYESAMKAQAGA